MVTDYNRRENAKVVDEELDKLNIQTIVSGRFPGGTLVEITLDDYGSATVIFKSKVFSGFDHEQFLDDVEGKKWDSVMQFHSFLQERIQDLKVLY
jgi:hypothetical protein